MAKKLEKTEYIDFAGKANWAKVYKPDEYEGAVRWTLNLEMTDEADIAKFKDYFPKKKLKDGENGGKSWAPIRPTTKLIKNKLVFFTPPVIYNKDGALLAGYTDDKGKLLRQYEDPKTVVLAGGERPLIGNGSDVVVTICVYPTNMGTGNRLESIKVLDLIEYKAPEKDLVWADGKKPEVMDQGAPVEAAQEGDRIPW